MGMAAEVGEGDDLALRAGELAQGPGQPLAVEGLRRCLVGLVPQFGRRGGLLVEARLNLAAARRDLSLLAEGSA